MLFAAQASGIGPANEGLNQSQQPPRTGLKAVRLLGVMGDSLL